MAVVRGKDFKLYVNDSDVPATPDWLELTNVRDVTRNLAKALADASTRLSDYRQQVGTLKDLSLDTQIVYDPADPLFVILQEAFDTDTNLEILDLDGSIDTAGSKGLKFMSQITNFTTAEALEDVGLVDVTFVVGYDSANPPVGVQVTTPGAVVPLVTGEMRQQNRKARATGNNTEGPPRDDRENTVDQERLQEVES